MQTRDKDLDGPDLDGLEALFAEARGQTVVPSDDVMARVLADGLALQPVPRAIVARSAPPVRRGLWDGLLSLFGGAGALAGMGSAAVAGLVLGFVQPAGLSDMTATLWGNQIESVSLMPSVDELIEQVTP